jgi:exosortase D (VPLPA-CTERM-specific)
MEKILTKVIQWMKQHKRATLYFALVVFLIFTFRTALEEQLGRVLGEERYSHAPLVFCMALYLIWIKRFEIRSHNSGAWTGVVIALFAGIAVMIGELSAIWTIVQYGMLLLCLGLAWAMIGNQIKKILVPFLHLFLVIPLPYMLDVMLSGKMQLVSSNLGVAITRLFGLSVYQEGNVIDLGLYKLQVVEACSGLNYMYPLMTIGLMMGYMYKAPFFARALLFLSSVPISIVMNSLRIAMVAILVNHSGIEAAEGFMHYFEGWVIFLICICLLLLEAKLLNLLLRMNNRKLVDSFDYLETKEYNEDSQQQSKVERAPIIVSVAIVLIASFSTLSIQHRAEVSPTRTTFSSYPLQLSGWQGRTYEFANGENEVLKLKDYFLANFNKSNTNIDVYLGYTDSQRAGFVPHSPKACIPGGGWEITDTRLQKINIDAGKTFEVTRMLISKGESKQLIYYWFHQRGRDLSNEFPMKFALLYDAIKMNRTDGAIVRFTTAVHKNETEADAVLTDFIRLNYPLFPKFIPN